MARSASLAYEKKLALWGWFFVTPGILFFSLFSFYPILNALWTSFLNKKLLSLKVPKFVGFDNYVYVLSSPDFWNSAKATILFAVSAAIPLILGSLILALIIYSWRRFQSLAQMALYSPAVLSSAVAALIWLLIFDPRGIGNQFANFFAGTNGNDYQWISDANMVRLSTVIVYVWKYIGYFVILFVVGIVKIPKSINEAAVIDGAGTWARLRYITLPLLQPTTVLISVVSFVQCLKTFSTQYLFTQRGAPIEPVNVITLSIYNTALHAQHLGRASVMSILLFIFMLLLSWLQLRLSKGGEEK